MEIIFIISLISTKKKKKLKQYPPWVSDVDVKDKRAKMRHANVYQYKTNCYNSDNE